MTSISYINELIKQMTSTVGSASFEVQEISIKADGNVDSFNNIKEISNKNKDGISKLLQVVNRFKI